MRNDNCKKKLLDNVSNGGFFLIFFFLTFVTFFSTVKLSTYLPYSLILYRERR